jgi:hypothetical protein
MSAQTEKPPKTGTEITVRISLTFQEAPDVHTLLTMTPVRERGKLVRLALERYIAETGHPAGDVEEQIRAISTWLRSRTARTETVVGVDDKLVANRKVNAGSTPQFNDVATSTPTHTAHPLAGTLGCSDSAPEEADSSASSIKRWLQA